jgi:NRAMP (natural resistance-associated macrophage protein)-like metal ion transporter
MAEMKKRLKDHQQQEKEQERNVEAGMVVESTEGDLGEEDVSKPKVSDVVRNQRGNVEKIAVQKGVVFKKELEVPAERIQEVNPDDTRGANGIVTIDARQEETESLHVRGHEALSPEEEVQQHIDPLNRVQEAIPTTEGMRDLETDSVVEQEVSQSKRQKISWWRLLGPGFIGGMSGNDASAVTAYAIDGAQNGFGHLWLMLLSTPMYQAVLYACAKIGRITQKGLAGVLREHYGRWLAALAALALIIANVALITADLVAIGSGFELITNINWVWFIIPVGLLLWFLTVYSNFDALKKVFIVMSLVFVAYIITALLARPNWNAIAISTFVPHIDFDFASISSAVALLGATISPYTMFWQVQGEKEEQRPGKTVKQQLHVVTVDIGSGTISGNVVAYFIIVSTAATLFLHHKGITTAADAAQSLVPVVGPFAKYLFAIGLIGSGLVAIPVLLASTSYAVSDTIGWPAGLSRKPWQSEGFYLILTLALIASLAMALLHLDPIKLIFWANIVSGILAPILVVCLMLIGNNRKIMGGWRLGWLTNLFLGITVVVLVVGSVLLFYGLLSGQGS